MINQLNYVMTEEDCIADGNLPPNICSVCCTYASPKDIGTKWLKLSVDMGGNVESGPNPDICEVVVCLECAGPIIRGEMTWFEAVADADSRE